MHGAYEASSVKSRVLLRKEPIDPRCAAYMHQLRTFNRTKRLLEVDPYVEVYELREGLFGLFSHSADGMGDPWSFLVRGAQRALLIDTGFGIGDLRGLVDELTGGMPLDVVNTHPHIDHSYGNAQFDRVHCHKHAVPYLHAQSGPRMWDHLLDEDGRGRWLDYDPRDVIAYRDHEVVGVPNHHVFDLGGGHEVELVFTGGHHAGHCVLLDRRHRVLFGGDAFVAMRVNVSGPKPGMPFPEYATVAAFHRELIHLADRVGEFDSVFPGHFIVELDPVVVPSLAATCARVLADPERPDFERELFGRRMRFALVDGLGHLAYRAESVGA